MVGDAGAHSRWTVGGRGGLWPDVHTGVHGPYCAQRALVLQKFGEKIAPTFGLKK